MELYSFPIQALMSGGFAAIENFQCVIPTAPPSSDVGGISAIGAFDPDTLTPDVGMLLYSANSLNIF